MEGMATCSLSVVPNKALGFGPENSGGFGASSRKVQQVRGAAWLPVIFWKLRDGGGSRKKQSRTKILVFGDIGAWC